LQVLRDNTKIAYDWSYIVAWAGIGTCLLAAILLSGAAVCLRNEREKEEQLNLQYLMPGKRAHRPTNHMQSLIPTFVSSLLAEAATLSTLSQLCPAADLSRTLLPWLAVRPLQLLGPKPSFNRGELYEQYQHRNHKWPGRKPGSPTNPSPVIKPTWRSNIEQPLTKSLKLHTFWQWQWQ